MAKHKGYREPYCITVPLVADIFMFLFIINVEVVVYTDACKAKGYNVWSDTNLVQYLQCTCELCNKKGRTKDLLDNFRFVGSVP